MLLMQWLSHDLCPVSSLELQTCAEVNHIQTAKQLINDWEGCWEEAAVPG